MNKVLLFLLSVVLLYLTPHAQTVDAIVWEGEEVFVYPYKIPVSAHSEYQRSVNMEDAIEFAFNQYSTEIRAEFGDEIDIKQFRKLIREMEGLNNQDEVEYLNKKFRKAVRKNPFPLLEQRYSFEQDITPALDPIPDGKYIQYFEPFCLVSSKGECREAQNIVAGIFHIKDNTLDGEACWLNIKGDTIKAGHFSDGLKTGKWLLERRTVSYSISRSSATSYIENGYPETDTTLIIADFRKGAFHGRYQEFKNSRYPIREGYFDQGEETGMWVLREPGYKQEGWRSVRKRNNDVVTLRYEYSKDTDTALSTKPWIRDGLIRTFGADLSEFDFISEYELVEIPRDLYKINFKNVRDLDLEGEKINSYDMYGEVDTEMEQYFPAESTPYYWSEYQASSFDPNSGEYLKRGQAIDSSGAKAKYTGDLIARYPNGQLAYHYSIVDGKLEVEDTVFWDNGTPHDVIAFLSDSNQYLRSIYDYSGKLYKSLKYDSLGDFIGVDYEYVKDDYVLINGLKAREPEYGAAFIYSNFDKLRTVSKGEVSLFRKWYKEDTSLLTFTSYYPEVRKLIRKNLAVTGRPTTVSEKVFSEDFRSWTGKDSSFIGPYTFEIVESGSLFEFEYDLDTIPQVNVGQPYNNFEVATTYKLLQDGDPYSGEVTLNFGKSKFKISKSRFSIDFPKQSDKLTKKNQRRMIRYREGKGKSSVLLDALGADEYTTDLGDHFFRSLMDPMLGNVFGQLPTSSFYNDLYGLEVEGAGALSRITGFMQEGRPTGEWKAFDNKNNLRISADFVKGELNGKVKYYDYASPIAQDQYWMKGNSFDTLPEKEVYYLSREVEYKNGYLQGKSVHYNWLKDEVASEYYHEGFLDGPAFERNNVLCSYLNYERGALDGYVRTYLTLEEKDSIMLYELNFQNGLLQGESKAYHTNGKLAKRGFFLNGEPIDDYEAFDSLGARYHYVKFKYSFPIEEKVWEENELSVRYMFDWQDSIYFEPSDITTTPSLESLLFDVGFEQEYLQRPYFGRKTLVDKTGVSYRMTKYYPNDQVARDGAIDNGEKVGCWEFYNYDGQFLYEVDYFDTLVVLNDSVAFNSKGFLSDYDEHGRLLSKSHIIEKFEKYDCSHTDHYEIRQFITVWEADDSIGRMNGYVTNYYDNGTIQSEGEMKDGLPTGFWKIYDPFGRLNQYGQYVSGKREGRWLSGDLSKTKYLGDICLNPNLPDLEEEIEYRENLLDVTITSYRLGKVISVQYYDINMNRFKDK